jgi:RHS repeat-associated protein
MLTIEADLNLTTGEVTDSVVDAYLPGRPAVAFVRSYSSQDVASGSLGHGWRHNLQLTLRRDGEFYLLGGGGAGDDRLAVNPQTGIFTTNSGGYFLQFDEPFTLVKSRNGSFWRFEQRLTSNSLRPHSREDIDGNRIEYFYSADALAGIRGASNRLLKFSYDFGERIVGVVFSHPSLSADVTLAIYRYDSSGNLVEAIDRSGVPIRYEYDRHRLVAITNRKGGRTYFAYDREGAGIARWRNDGGRYRYFRRDATRKRVEMTNSRGDRWLSTFDERGNVTRRVDPLRRVHENVYDPNGGLMMSDMEPASVPCISVADESAGTETRICGDKETKITYNAFDKPVLIEAPEGNTKSFRYDEKGHLIETTGPSGSPVQFAYSPTGDVIALTDPRGNQTQWEITDLAIKCWDQIGSLGSSRFDSFGNLERVSDPYGNETRLLYDPAGHLGDAIFPDGGRQHFGYDEAGYPLELRYKNDSKVGFESDLFGRPTGYVDTNGARYTLAWDTEDNLTEVVNPAGEALHFSYDACDRINRVTHYDGRVTLVENDDRDRPIRYLNATSNVETAASFNDVGLIRSRAATKAPAWEFSYGENGQLLGAASELGQWTEKWSKQGRWIGEDSPNRKLEIERDSIGRRVGLRDNHGLEIEYVWDIRSRLTQMTINGVWTWKFEYDLRDLIVRAHTPGNFTLTLSYDLMQRMTERTLRAADGVVLASRKFQWTSNDDLVRIEDLRLGVKTIAVDTGGSLLAVRGSRNETYVHDALRNVLTSATGEPITIGPGNRLLSAGATRFFYNQDGHIARQTGPDGEIEYNYDGDGLLKSVKTRSSATVENEYDFIARRTRKSFDGNETRFYWDGQFLQGEQTGSDPPTYYITLPESPIPLGLLREGRMDVLLFDQIGTVTEAFDETGTLSWAADCTAFGQLRAEAGSLAQPIRALGQYHDRETGLYYNWFRHYSPTLGRYISADPVGYRYSQNPYWYSSNPHSWVDYDGLGSLSGTTLTLDWRCDWTKEQKKDFVNKIAAQNDHIDEKGPAKVPAAKSYKRPCGTAADKWRNECEEDASAAEKKRPVKNTGDPCKDNDADHQMELVLGGENECHNMTPCNASVNRSCGSQIGSVLRDPANAGGTITEVVAAKKCTPPSGDTKPCTPNWSASAKLT